MSKNNNSRTHNVIWNSAVGIIASLIQVVLNYAVRIVLVRTLGDEFNGIHNLFQNIINVMVLIEAGFGTAMIIHLYKPAEEHDEEKVRSLMAFYRKLYLFISLGFLVAAVFIDLFVLKNIIETTIPFTEVSGFFMLFSLSFVLNYATYYKRSLIYAEQKNRISTLATLISEILFRTAEVVSLGLWRDYRIFLVLMIFEKLIGNTICNLYVKKYHPYLKKRGAAPLETGLKRSVFAKVRNLFVFNASQTVQQSSKTILVSMLLGNVANVGFFGNYQLVVNTSQLLFSQFGASFTTAFGNLAIAGKRDEMFAAYKKSAFVMNWLAVLISAGFLACIQDFIFVTFGDGYLLPTSCVLILVLDMFVYLYTIPCISVQNALGLHNLDRTNMIIQAVLAVVLGYFGGLYFGMVGILVGLLLPQIVWTLIIKGIILFKSVFAKSASDFLRYTGSTFVKFFVTVGATYLATAFFSTGNHFADVLIKGIIAVTISAVSLLTFSGRSEYLGDLLGMLKIKKK